MVHDSSNILNFFQQESTINFLNAIGPMIFFPFENLLLSDTVMSDSL